MKRRAIKIKTLAFQSWLYIVMFSMFILLTLILLQVFFLKTFYEGMKTREIIRIGEELTRTYGEERFEQTLQESAFRGGIMAMLVDENGVSVSGFGFMVERMAWARFGFDFERVKQAFDESGTGSVHFTGGDEGRRFVVYISRLDKPDGPREYLVVMSFLPPIDSTARILQYQLRLIMLIILLMSLVVARMLSRRLSKPIIELTSAAKRMADGDFTVEFTGDGYNEIKELSDTLNYAAAEISKSDRYQKELLANVSHDLRTPLTLIKFYGEMIRDVSGADEAKRTEACETIIKEADWLTEMVNELLELSKIHSADAKPDMRDFDISGCLGSIMATIGVLVERDGYVIECDIDEGIAVKGNEHGIKRAMYNLIGNALDYTGEDKRVRVRLKRADGSVRFEVSDTGAGVRADEMERVWERYFKSGTVHKRGIIGTGIGLAITKNVLEAHGAEYGVENLAEGGARFWFDMRLS